MTVSQGHWLIRRAGSRPLSGNRRFPVTCRIKIDEETRVQGSDADKKLMMDDEMAKVKRSSKACDGVDDGWSPVAKSESPQWRDCCVGGCFCPP